jgi:hypothetical protein
LRGSVESEDVGHQVEATADRPRYVASGDSFLPAVVQCREEREAGIAGHRVGVDGQPGLSLVGRVWCQDVVEVQILVHEAVAGFREHLLERGSAGLDEAVLRRIADERQGAWCTVEQVGAEIGQPTHAGGCGNGAEPGEELGEDL